MSRLRAIAVLFALASVAPATEPRDAAGDPLPPGAVARLGTVRWRGGSPVVFCAYLPDGKSLLTAGQDHVVAIWDVATGLERRRFEVAGGILGAAPGGRMNLNLFAMNVALSADGRVLACGGRDGVLRAWDIASGTEIASFPSIVRINTRIALSPDGKRLAAIGNDGSLKLMNVEPGAEAKPVGKASANDVRTFPYRLEFSTDGKSLLQGGIEFAGNGSTLIIVWDLTAGTQKHRFNNLPGGANASGVMRSAVSPDHKRLALPLADGVALVDLETGKELKKLTEVSEPLRCSLLFSPDGKTLVAATSRCEELCLWDPADGKLRKQFSKPANPAPPVAVAGAMIGAIRMAGQMAISLDGKTVAWSEGPAINFADLNTGQARPSPAGHMAGLKSANFSQAGKTILTRGNDALVLRWDAVTAKLLGRVEVPGQAVMHVESNDGKLIVTGEPNTGLMRVYEAATAKELRSIQPDMAMGFGYSFGLSPDGKTLAVVGRGSGAAQLYDVATGKKTQDLVLPPPPTSPNPMVVGVISAFARRLLFSPDSRLVGVTTEHRLTVWDMVLRCEVQRIDFPEGAILRYAALSPDHRAAALEFIGGELGIWELATGTRRQTLQTGTRANTSDPNALMALRQQVDGTGYPMTLAYSEDGRLLARGGEDRTIRIWDGRTGREVGSFTGHRGSLMSVSFSPDGRRLVSGSADTTALVWDTARLQLPAVDGKLEPAAIAAHAAALGEADATKAYPAIVALAADPNHAIDFLKETVKPVPAPDVKAVEVLIAGLSDRSFVVRERSRKGLEELGVLAAPSLREALAGGPTAEARQLARRLLEGLVHRPLPAEQVRLVRVVEMLELAGTPEAVNLLRKLSGGAAEAAPTVAAQSALDRLNADGRN
ncbi:MAG: WD40 repeat domain-containing protein [Gemmataceae bacterium]